jgi:hypothetical protein
MLGALTRRRSLAAAPVPQPGTFSRQ